MEEKSNNKSIVRVAMLAGQIMLQNGAETYRVEDTMERICIASGILSVDTFATPTGIFISVRTDSYEYSTTIKRVRNRTTDLYKIYEVNDISRRLVNKEIVLSEALHLLEELDLKAPLSSWLSVASAGGCSGVFALLLGGSTVDTIITAFTGAMIQFIHLISLSKKISYFLTNIVGGVIAAGTAIIFAVIFNTGSLDKIIIGSIIPLLPGIAITSAIRDTIYGDLVSGTTRGVEAFLIAISIASGVGIVLRTWLIIIGGLPL